MADLPKRRLLGGLVRAVAAGLTALYAIPAFRYLRGRPRVDAPVELDLGPLDAIPEGEPRLVAIRTGAVDGWSEGRGASAGLFLVRRGDEVRALDAACPHSGCSVSWDATQRGFRCPCHRSAFAADGARLSGPAPRGLDEQAVEVRAGRVRVRYRHFRAGRPEREPT